MFLIICSWRLNIFIKLLSARNYESPSGMAEDPDCLTSARIFLRGSRGGRKSDSSRGCVVATTVVAEDFSQFVPGRTEQSASKQSVMVWFVPLSHAADVSVRMCCTNPVWLSTKVKLKIRKNLLLVSVKNGAQRILKFAAKKYDFVQMVEQLWDVLGKHETKTVEIVCHFNAIAALVKQFKKPSWVENHKRLLERTNEKLMRNYGA